MHVFTAGIPAAASPPPAPTGEPPLRVWRRGLIADVTHAILHEEQMQFGHELHFQYSAASLCAIEAAHIEIQRRLITLEDNINNNFDNLLQKMDAAWTENTALREAYRASREETAALKAAVDSLTQKIDEQLAIPAPPSPDLAASPTTMEEMTMQLSVVQHDIQDILEAVCKPPGKRKRRTSNQDAEPTTPTNRRPATNKQRNASPQHSLMHSQHATSAAQDALDALMRKYPPRPLAITSTEATTDPLPDSHAIQDTTLPDAPVTNHE
jgi:chromosome segregation ATPase